MKKSIKKAQALLALGCICVLTMAGFCGGDTEQTTEREPASQPVSKVDQFFSLAKEFSEHKKSIDDLKTSFSELKDDEVKKLGETKSGDFYLTHYLAKGQASADTATLLDQFLGKLEADKAKDLVQKKADSKNALGMVRDSANRHQSENDGDRHYVAAVLMHYDNAQVNDDFDSTFFNGALSKMDSTRATKVYQTISVANVTTWMNWAVSNKTAAQPVYKNMYAQVGANSKTAMRNKMLAGAIAAGTAEVEAFIDSLNAWNLNTTLATDTYDHGALSGSLLKVLMEDAHATATPAAYKQLRVYATKIKNHMGAAYAAYALPVNTDLAGYLTTARTGFSHYYLAYDEVAGLVDAAAAKLLVPNKPFADLFHDVRKDVANAIADLPAAAAVGGDKFIHLLVNRPADADTKGVLTKYLTKLAALPGNLAAAEAKALNTAGPSNALQLLYAPRPAGDVAAELKEMRIALANADDGTALDTLVAANLEDLVKKAFKRSVVSGGLGGEAMFNKMHTAAHLSAPNKKILRDKLYDLCKTSGVPAVNSMIDNRAAWGLDLGTDIYGAAAGHPLLQQLVNDAHTAATAGAYAQLRAYALKIKGAMLATYGVHAGPIKVDLDTKLTNTHTGFANYYLALDEVKGLLEAVDAITVTNSNLRQLYALVVTDLVSAQAVAAAAALNPADGNKFIHKVALRAADADSSHIFTDYLTKLGAAGAATELKAPNATAPNPHTALQLLHGVHGARPHAETHLQPMKDAAMANDDGSTLSMLAQAELEALAQDAFNNRIGHGAGTGENKFKALYGKAALSANAKKFMRNKLLGLAYAAKADVIAMIGTIAPPSDPWGLQASIDTDTYELAQNPAVPAVANHDGSLLYVFSARAIEDKTAGTATAYTDLQDYAKALKLVVENKGPGTYLAYATNAHALKDARALLVAELTKPVAAKDKLHGYAEYYLNLDQSAPGFDENLVMAAADSEAVENAVLKFLYDKAIKSDATNAKAFALKALNGTAVADNFINRLAAWNATTKRVADADLLAVLREYLKAIEAHTATSALAESGANGAVSGNNAWVKLLDNLRTDKNAALEQMILHIAFYDDGTLVAALADDVSTANLLSATFNQGDKSYMDHVFAFIPDARIKPLIELCAKNRATAIVNDPTNALGPIFAAEYAKPGRAAVKDAMRNGLIKEAYDVAFLAKGSTGADNAEAGLLAILDVIANDFFVAADLEKNDFDPFASGTNGRLFYAAIKKADVDAGGLHSVTNAKATINALAIGLKAKVTSSAAWQKYLNSKNNGAGTNADRILVIIAGPTLAGNQATAKANDWLDF